MPEKQVPRNSDNRGLDDRLCRILVFYFPSDTVPLFLSKLTFHFSNKKITFTLLTDVLNMLNPWILMTHLTGSIVYYQLVEWLLDDAEVAGWLFCCI